MIRVSKHSLKFSNKIKKESLFLLQEVYGKQLVEYIELIKSEKLPLKTLLSSSVLPGSFISHSRYKQLIYKRASEIVRGELVKIRNRIFKKYKKLYYNCSKENKHKNFTGKLFKDLNINYLKRVKINIKKVPIMLDERFFDIEKGNSFDEFVNIFLPIFRNGKKRLEQIKVPIKHHKQSLKFKDWKRKKCVQLEVRNGTFYLSFFYEKEIETKKEIKNQIGIDIGYNKLISDSNGIHYGVNLKKIYENIAKKKKNSKGYLRAINYKTNETNRIVNKFIEINEPDLVVCEDLKDVKKNSKLYRELNNKLQYWSYLQVIDKLVRLSEIKGFELKKVESAYTSQTCSKCGNINKLNRKGEVYQCSCGLFIDADTNASINILHRGVYSSSITKK